MAPAPTFFSNLCVLRVFAVKYRFNPLPEERCSGFTVRLGEVRFTVPTALPNDTRRETDV
jgi:hypothetical protein